MCQACKGLGRTIVVDAARLLDLSRSIRDGGITHPDFKVGGWNWREIVGANLFDSDTPIGQFTAEDLDRLLHADGVPITKPHGAGTYAKTWVGVARRLETVLREPGRRRTERKPPRCLPALPDLR